MQIAQLAELNRKNDTLERNLEERTDELFELRKKVSLKVSGS